MKKRVLALIMSVTMILSAMPMTALASGFSDMPNDWSTEALEKAVDNGLLKGAGGQIRAQDNLTRAEMAAIVNRAFNSKNKADIRKFTDVSNASWYYNDMAKAVGMKVFEGNGNKLDPEDNITREQVFAVLVRAFKIPKSDSGSLDNFYDQGNISPWAREDVSAIVSAGYIEGSNGYLNPKQEITRAEFAKIMDNLVKTYIKENGQYTKDFKGNVMVNEAGVTLKGLTIWGDLIIGDGVGDGEVTLDDVEIEGRLVIRSGGVKPEPEPTNLVESISVISENESNIVIENNKLQMIANISPTNATDKSIEWSLKNGTGSATIDSTGLLKGLSEGTVTIIATSKDGSDVKGREEITITKPEIDAKELLEEKLHLDEMFELLPIKKYVEIFNNEGRYNEEYDSFRLTETEYYKDGNISYKEVYGENHLLAHFDLTARSENEFVNIKEALKDKYGKPLSEDVQESSYNETKTTRWKGIELRRNSSGLRGETTQVWLMIPEKTSKNELNKNEIIAYLIENFGTLDTNIGTTTFKFDVSENKSTYYAYDYWVQVGYEYDFFSGAINSIDYTNEQKNELKQELKEHQKNIAEALMLLLPDKKFSGGYYDSWYRYPNLKVDLITRKYYSWTNYDEPDMYSDISNYEQTKPSYFRWYDFMDDEL